MRLTPGQAHDLIGARALLAAVPAPGSLIDDKAYDGDDLRHLLTAQGTIAVIAPIRRRLAPPPFDGIAYRQRNLIERAFCRLKDAAGSQPVTTRRLATFLAGLCLAVIHWLG